MSCPVSSKTRSHVILCFEINFSFTFVVLLLWIHSRTICVYLTYEVVVIRYTCALNVIHNCFMHFSFIHQSRVSADGVLRDFGCELFKNFGRCIFEVTLALRNILRDAFAMFRSLWPFHVLCFMNLTRMYHRCLSLHLYIAYVAHISQ
jgi:hypothetical protein